MEVPRTNGNSFILLNIILDYLNAHDISTEIINFIWIRNKILVKLVLLAKLKSYVQQFLMILIVFLKTCWIQME